MAGINYFALTVLELMKKNINCFGTLFFVFILYSCVNKTYLKRGLISQNRYFTNVTDSTILPDFDKLESKIWFSDSCVIFEMKVINDSINYAPKGTLRKYSYELFKYSYLDLRTLKCQDYLSFSDTALPINNYFLRDSEVLSWRFYSEKRAQDVNGEITSLSDTIVGNRFFKRVKIRRFINKDIGYEYHIFYLDCKAKKTIFHINRTIDEQYPKCQIVSSELWNDYNSVNKEVFEINVLKSNLSSKEKKIFNQWGKNAKQTELPLRRYTEILSEFKYQIKGKNYIDSSKEIKAFDLMREN
jgi:hypothetical protein